MLHTRRGMTLPLGLAALQGFFCSILPEPLELFARALADDAFLGRLAVAVAAAGSVAAASRPR